jgi:hypothetical protein
MWKNSFSQLLKLDRVSDVRQTEIHTTAEQFVSEFGPFEVAITKPKTIVTDWAVSTR